MSALERLAAPALGGDQDDAPAKFRLRDELEDLRLDPSLHRLAEIAAFQACVRDDISLPPVLLADVARLLSTNAPVDRARVEADSPLASAAAADRWKTYSNDPRRSPDEQRVAEVFVRSFELAWAAGQIVREAEGDVAERAAARNLNERVAKLANDAVKLARSDGRTEDRSAHGGGRTLAGT